MSSQTSVSGPLRTQRPLSLGGTVTLPGDAAIARRVLLVGAMALGETILVNLPEPGLASPMAGAVRALGARLERRGENHALSGLGAGGLLQPDGDIDTGDDAEAAGLVAGAAGIYPFATRFGAGAAPPDAILGRLADLGVSAAETDGRVAIRGPITPVPGTFAATSGLEKDALLLAAIAIPGISTVVVEEHGAGHLETLLKTFGARVGIADDDSARRAVSIEGLPDLRATTTTIPGDAAFAAALMVTGLVVAKAEIVLGNVLLNPWRAGMLDTLARMGADLTVLEPGRAAGEDVAAVRVRHCALEAVHLLPGQTALIARDLPILAVAAALASGDTVIEGVVDDPDGAIGALTAGLAVNGVAWELHDGRLIVHGRGRATGGGRIPPHPDPRVALAFLIMGLATRDPITVEDAGGVERGFPGLLGILETLGARFRREAVA